MQQESVSAAEQVRAGTALAAEGFGHAVRQVEQVHRAVAGGRSTPSARSAASPRAVHDGVTSGVYAAVRGGGAVAARGARSLGRPAARPGRDGSATGRRPSWPRVNGAWGDHLDAPRRARWPLPWAGAATAQTSPPEPDDARRAPSPRPPATSPCWSTGWWRTRLLAARRPRDAEGRRPAGLGAPARRASSGATPAGAALQQRAARLPQRRRPGRLLEATVQAWPVPVTRLSAWWATPWAGWCCAARCTTAASRATPGPATVQRPGHARHAAPRGAAGEGDARRRAGPAAPARRRPPRWRPPLESRSAGVKDLRHGYLLDGDWLDTDPDAAAARHSAPRCRCAEGVRHHVVAAGADPGPGATRVGRLLGRPAGAGGQRRGAGRPGPGACRSPRPRPTCCPAPTTSSCCTRRRCTMWS